MRKKAYICFVAGVFGLFMAHYGPPFFSKNTGPMTRMLIWTLLFAGGAGFVYSMLLSNNESVSGVEEADDTGDCDSDDLYVCEDCEFLTEEEQNALDHARHLGHQVDRREQP